jgi:hypothetical protein
LEGDFLPAAHGFMRGETPVEDQLAGPTDAERTVP